ncbi:hypothetical protein ACE7GA_03150 [Roseomonas sp. CCTCC AB2023176]|uniref:hypothetical protein n=1 Tax=Roseomonas sp. CCTCC AB2023176 TaxID=3342640 RepID=UPI0035E0251C
MPYLIEALLFASPFALYALWVRFNPGRAVASHVLILALIGVFLSIGAAAWYGLSRGMDRGTAYVPPRLEGNRVEPGHSATSRGDTAWPPVGPSAPVPPPYQGPPR